MPDVVDDAGLETSEPDLGLDTADYSGVLADDYGEALAAGDDLSAEFDVAAPSDIDDESVVEDGGDDLSSETPVLQAPDVRAPLEPATPSDTDATPAEVGEARSPQDVQEWVADVNPLSTFGPEGAGNCGSCALAVDSRLDGSSPDAVADASTLTIADMEAATGRPQVSATPGDIEAGLLAAGPGSKSVIGIDRADGPGHWFNAYNDGGRIVYIDGQTGEVGDWPPANLGNVSAWDWNGPS